MRLYLSDDMKSFFAFSVNHTLDLIEGQVTSAEMSGHTVSVRLSPTMRFLQTYSMFTFFSSISLCPVVCHRASICLAKCQSGQTPTTLPWRSQDLARGKLVTRP